MPDGQVIADPADANQCHNDRDDAAETQPFPQQDRGGHTDAADERVPDDQRAHWRTTSPWAANGWTAANHGFQKRFGLQNAQHDNCPAAESEGSFEI